LIHAASSALDQFSASDCSNFFRHAFYTTN
jgi:hypothetical protein